MCSETRQLTLPDGRRLAFDLHGPPAGRPILLFHGTPSSRLGWYTFGSQLLAERLNIRVIAPDRPGLGLSTFQPNRRIIDWPADVVALADALGLDRFAVLGYSGGGPYALACALAFPGRLTAAGILGGVGPYEPSAAASCVHPAVLLLLELARDRPRLAEWAFQLLAALARHAPGSLIGQAMAILQGPDRQALAQPTIWQAVLGAYLEALRPGPRGVRQDAALMVSPWGLDPRAVAMPVHLWHGEEDHFASPCVVRHLVAALPRVQARFYPGEGHVTLLLNYGASILDELASGGPG